MEIEAKKEKNEDHLNHSFDSARESPEAKKKAEPCLEFEKLNLDIDAKETKKSSKKLLPEAIPGIKIGENPNIDLLNEQLLKEREMFQLQDKKIAELRVKYVDMISMVGDLEENIDDLTEQLESKNDLIQGYIVDIEKKVNY